MYVKPDPFRLALMTLGINPDLQPTLAGVLFGVDAKTVKRVLGGGIASERFMANVVGAFRLNAAKLYPTNLRLNSDEFFEPKADEPMRELVPA